MNKINFVRKRQKELTKLEVQDQRYLKWAGLGIGGVLAVFIVVLGIRITLGFQLSATNESINSLKASINSKSEIEAQYVVFMTKVKMLTDLFAQRKEKQEAIAYFASLFDPKIIISQLSYSANTNTLNFTLRAPTVFDLGVVFSTLRSANVRGKYPTYAVTQLARADDGSYGLGINLPLPTRPLDELSQSADVQTDGDQDQATTGSLDSQSSEEDEAF